MKAITVLLQQADAAWRDVSDLPMQDIIAQVLADDREPAILVLLPDATPDGTIRAVKGWTIRAAPAAPAAPEKTPHLCHYCDTGSHPFCTGWMIGGCDCTCAHAEKANVRPAK